MKTKSIWGNPPKRIYKLIDMGLYTWGDFEACVVGCSDGKFLMPFARKHIDVTGYDIDGTSLFGGEKDFPIIDKKVSYKYDPNFKSKEYKLEKRRIYGVLERLAMEEITKYAHIEKRDFYRDIPNKKFNIVFTSCSLHYDSNKDFSLEDKTNKLKSIVKKDGLLYMDYILAIDENDYKKYPKEKYFRKGEILNYFGDNWDIISIRENDKPTFEEAHVDNVKDHFVRYGYVLARRVK